MKKETRHALIAFFGPLLFGAVIVAAFEGPLKRVSEAEAAPLRADYQRMLDERDRRMEAARKPVPVQQEVIDGYVRCIPRSEQRAVIRALKLAQVDAYQYAGMRGWNIKGYQVEAAQSIYSECFHDKPIAWRRADPEPAADPSLHADRLDAAIDAVHSCRDDDCRRVRNAELADLLATPGK